MKLLKNWRSNDPVKRRSAKTRLILSNGSRETYRSIVRESTRRFGETQAKRYRADFEAAFARLREYLEFGTLHQELGSGIRRLLVGSHVLYYQLDGNLITIVEILHQRQSEYKIDWTEFEE